MCHFDFLDLSLRYIFGCLKILRYVYFVCFVLPFQWIPELQHYAPGVPIVLVGTKLGEFC